MKIIARKINDMISKYNVNAKYCTKDLKGGYNSNNFSLLDVYLDEKGTSVKIQLPSHCSTTNPYNVGYDEWLLSLALWRKFDNSHGKYKPELNHGVIILNRSNNS